MNYPCWMYHAEHGARLFENAAEFEAAGAGWADNPQAAKDIADPPIRPGEPMVTRGRRK